MREGPGHSTWRGCAPLPKRSSSLNLWAWERAGRGVCQAAQRREDEEPGVYSRPRRLPVSKGGAPNSYSPCSSGAAAPLGSSSTFFWLVETRGRRQGPGFVPSGFRGAQDRDSGAGQRREPGELAGQPGAVRRRCSGLACGRSAVAGWMPTEGRLLRGSTVGCSAAAAAGSTGTLRLLGCSFGSRLFDALFGEWAKAATPRGRIAVPPCVRCNCC